MGSYKYDTNFFMTMISREAFFPYGVSRPFLLPSCDTAISTHASVISAERQEGKEDRLALYCLKQEVTQIRSISKSGRPLARTTHTILLNCKKVRKIWRHVECMVSAKYLLHSFPLLPRLLPLFLTSFPSFNFLSTLPIYFH